VDRSYRNGIVLLAGLALIGLALSLRAILIETEWWVTAIGLVGLALTGWASYQLRTELGAMVRQRRGEVALYTIGTVGVFLAFGYFTAVYTLRIDMTTAGLYSLSPQTINVLRTLKQPVRITYFHDPMMRESKEMVELYGRYSDKIELEFYDPNLNPAQARLHGVQFAGTAVLESEGRTLKLNGGLEADFTNGILRVTQGKAQLACFLDGHNEADPFSQESHEHLEGTMSSHTHGLGTQYVLHQVHGLAKARHALEATNYKVEKVVLKAGIPVSPDCSVLIVAGPKIRLLPQEVESIRGFLHGGGNALFMLEPYIESGLEPILEEYGMVAEENMIIDEASHFWSDLSSPAVTKYYTHRITQDVPLTFYPGARSIRPAPRRDSRVTTDPLVDSSRSSFGETDRGRAEYDPAKDMQGPLTIMVLAIKRFGGDFFEFSNAGNSGANRADTPGTSQPESADQAAAVDTEGSGQAKQSRLIVVGDSDFATNSFFHYLGNGNLFLNAVNYLASRENLIGIEPPTYDLPRVSLTNRQMKGTFFLAVVLIPAISALVGIGVWWKQR
jgi:ABC-type uncharacterized transport system involved in gliding motility auxiliary subunit